MPHFGLPTRAIVELERLAEQAGTGPVAGRVGDEVILPALAGEMAAKLRAFLADATPGPKGSFTDREMLKIAAAYASFCEQAAEQGGIASPRRSRRDRSAVGNFNSRLEGVETLRMNDEDCVPLYVFVLVRLGEESRRRFAG